jgi:alpha-1,2-mannosyltransferase
MWGGGIDLAYAAQASVALAIAIVLIWVWLSDVAFDLKVSMLAVAVLIATPYLQDYDLMILAVAVAFYVRYSFVSGFDNFELSLLAFVWIAPLVSRALAGATGIPLGLIAQLVLFTMGLRRARGEMTDASWRFAAAQRVRAMP